MASVYGSRGRLNIGFALPHQGQRIACNEALGLKDTRANRQIAKRKKKKIEGELAEGTFNYGKHFPGSRKLARLGLAPPSVPTLHEFAEQWLDQKKSLKSPATASHYRSLFRVYLLEDPLALKPLNTVVDSDIVDLICRLKGRGLSADRLNRLRSALHGLFHAGRRYLPINPISEVDRLSTDREGERIDPFTAEEAQALISSASGQDRRLLTVALATGVRRGELFALKWIDVDLRARTIHIQRSRGQFGEGPPKTGRSNRVIDIPAIALEALQQQQAYSRLRSEYVFVSNRRGKDRRRRLPLDPHNWVQKRWPLLVERTKVGGKQIRYRPFKQTRHAFAILWLLGHPEGDLRLLADQLGHTTLAMLYRHYLRWMPGRIAKPAGDAITKALTATTQQPESGAQS